MLVRLTGCRCLSLVSLVILAVSTLTVAQEPVDNDHDGLPDSVEQSLLEKFRPTFMISAKDCAVRPSNFKTGQATPEPIAQDGTIYGQAFPVPNSNHIEIHYYTLWDQDCGRISHPLDVEHISVLTTNEPEPKALYWFAGAHEKTVCDISSGARAEAIGSVDRGPRVWSSSGKHAIYLRKEMCGHGCGSDSCDNDSELARAGQVVNLGERDAPANGAFWITSKQWLLSEKMGTDFPNEVIARLDATSGDTVLTLGGNKTIRGTIEGSDVVLGAASTGVEHTGAALDTANTNTSKSLGTATKATGRSLKRAWKSVFGPKKETGAKSDGRQ
jgi:hypothetical protein